MGKIKLKIHNSDEEILLYRVTVDDETYLLSNRLVQKDIKELIYVIEGIFRIHNKKVSKIVNIYPVTIVENNKIKTGVSYEK